MVCGLRRHTSVRMSWAGIHHETSSVAQNAITNNFLPLWVFPYWNWIRRIYFSYPINLFSVLFICTEKKTIYFINNNIKQYLSWMSTSLQIWKPKHSIIKLQIWGIMRGWTSTTRWGWCHHWVVTWAWITGFNVVHAFSCLRFAWNTSINQFLNQLILTLLDMLHCVPSDHDNYFHFLLQSGLCYPFLYHQPMTYLQISLLECC